MPAPPGVEVQVDVVTVFEDVLNMLIIPSCTVSRAVTQTVLWSVEIVPDVTLAV